MRIVAHHGTLIGNGTLAHLTTFDKLGYRFWRMPATRFSVMIRAMRMPYIRRQSTDSYYCVTVSPGLHQHQPAPIFLEVSPLG